MTSLEAYLIIPTSDESLQNWPNVSHIDNAVGGVKQVEAQVEAICEGGVVGLGVLAVLRWTCKIL